MIEKLQRNMRKNKKGFTLVEVIVVLVILAILAAILIPSMVKWIDKAESKTITVEARTVLLAAQTEASDQYANDKTATTVDAAKVMKLADVEGDLSDDGVTVAAGKVTGFTYSTDAYTITYANGKFGDPVKNE